MILGLLAVPLLLLATWTASAVQHVVFWALPARAATVPNWVAATVGTQAMAALGAIALFLRMSEWTHGRPSLTLLLMVGGVAMALSWRWADQAEWDRLTGRISSPDDDVERTADAVHEVTARATLIGMAAGVAVGAVWFRSLPLI